MAGSSWDNVLGLRARDRLAESTGLWVEAGPWAGWRGGVWAAKQIHPLLPRPEFEERN